MSHINPHIKRSVLYLLCQTRGFHGCFKIKSALTSTMKGELQYAFLCHQESNISAPLLICLSSVHTLPSQYRSNKRMSQMRLKKMSKMRLKRPSYMRLRRGPSMMRLKKSDPGDCVWVRGICIDNAEVEMLNHVKNRLFDSF